MNFKLSFLAIAYVLSVLIPAISLGLVGRYYGTYYKYMKKHFHDEWSRLMKSDLLIDSFGEGYRWPFGSSSLISSFFSKKNLISDAYIDKLKRKSILCFKVFLISLSFSILLFLFFSP